MGTDSSRNSQDRRDDARRRRNQRERDSQNIDPVPKPEPEKPQPPTNHNGTLYFGDPGTETGDGQGSAGQFFAGDPFTGGYVVSAEDRYEEALEDFDRAIGDYDRGVANNQYQVVTGEDGRQRVERYTGPGAYTPPMAGGDRNPEHWETVNDFGGLYDKLDELANIDYQTVGEWADSTGQGGRYDRYRQGMDEMADQIAGGITDEDVLAGRNYAAEAMGFGDWANMESVLQGLVSEIDAGADAQQGMSDRELDTYRRAANQNIDLMEAEMDRDLDAVAAEGSTMRYMAAADEARRQIANQRLAAETEILQADFERRQLNFQQKKEMWGQMVQFGTMAEQQYTANITANRVNAFKAYSEGMTSLMQEHSSDLKATMAHAENIYNQINAEIGITEHAFDVANQYFEQAMAPLLSALTGAQMRLDEAFGALNVEEAES